MTSNDRIKTATDTISNINAVKHKFNRNLCEKTKNTTVYTYGEEQMVNVK